MLNIDNVEMLGAYEKLNYELTPEGLKVKFPKINLQIMLMFSRLNSREILSQILLSTSIGIRLFLR